MYSASSCDGVHIGVVVMVEERGLWATAAHATLPCGCTCVTGR